jgi:hypothetical protein
MTILLGDGNSEPSAMPSFAQGKKVVISFSHAFPKENFQNFTIPLGVYSLFHKME